jgi:hypothetical protein
MRPGQAQMDWRQRCCLYRVYYGFRADKNDYRRTGKNRRIKTLRAATLIA